MQHENLWQLLESYLNLHAEATHHDSLIEVDRNGHRRTSSATACLGGYAMSTDMFEYQERIFQ